MNKKVMLLDEEGHVGVITDSLKVQKNIKAAEPQMFGDDKTLKFDFSDEKHKVIILPKNARKAVFDFSFLKQIFNYMSSLQEEPNRVEFTVANNKPILIRFKTWNDCEIKSKSKYENTDFWVAPMVD